MSARSLNHLRTHVTVGTKVRTPLGARIEAAAKLHGKSKALWAREALIEKLEREIMPSIIP